MKIEQDFNINYTYNILFTEDVFSTENNLLEATLCKNMDAQKKVKVAYVVDQGLVDAQPELLQKIVNYTSDSDKLQLLAEPLLVLGGEQVKNEMSEFYKTLALINDAKIDRHSFMVIIGGGAVLDMAGFAAAIGHRGIRHIRIPTTVLSQNDSGVGVKNGINFFGKKNFLGAFAPPYAVINDNLFLKTLSDRDWLSGISEAIKVALIKDAKFFDWLEANALLLKNRDMEAMKKMVFECGRLHSDHISNSNDPFEMGSSRPLDYGHWAAHKMEQLTNFKLKHGEAVAVGLGLDLIYGNLAGFMDEPTTERALNLLSNIGFKLFNPVLLNEAKTAINPELLKGIEEFREHLGGELTITMVGTIGKKFDVHEMNEDWLNAAVLKLKEKNSDYAY